MNHTCPICHKTIKTSVQKPCKKSSFFPFCSERCKLIDLGEWLDARYKVVSSLQSEKSDLPSHRSLSESDM